MQTKLKATPGPWVLHLRDKTKTARVNGAGGIYITQRDFTSNTAADQERIVSDLHLIAAAPDLYAACEAMERYQNLLTSGATNGLIKAYADAFESALAALAKARGEK